MRHGAVVAMVLVATVAGWPTWGQTLEPTGPFSQIDTVAPRAERARAGQVGQPGRNVAPGGIAPVEPARRGAQPTQITSPGDVAAPIQLAPAGQSARGPAQVAPVGRNAQPPAPLSTPAQGRTGAVARVEGRDRCDPAAKNGARARCATVIETRGGEFPPPSAEPLSPEQRLLVEDRTLDQRGSDQRRPAADAIARSAARRVGRDGADATSPAMQGIASVVLAPPPPAANGDPTAGLTPEQAAAATSTLGAIGNTKP